MERLSARFAAVKHAQHKDGVAVVSILQDLRSAENLEHKFAVLAARGEWPSQLWVPSQDLSPADEFVCDAAGEVGMLVVEKRRESIEVGEGVQRPLDVYWSCHGRNWAVPQVRSQCTTRS